MKFLDREDELARLLAMRRGGGLAVISGRRRVGKTRLLTEWVERTGGVERLRHALSAYRTSDKARRHVSTEASPPTRADRSLGYLAAPSISRAWTDRSDTHGRGPIARITRAAIAITRSCRPANLARTTGRDPKGIDDDAHTREVTAKVIEEGVCYPSITTSRGRAGMRLSVSNWSTDEDDVRRSVDAIRQAHRVGARTAPRQA